MRVAYVHIGKSAGTWLRAMLQDLFEPSERCPFLFQHEFENIKDSYIAEKSFFSAHIGIETARQLNAKTITVLRNPFDRILSLYYYWREVENGPISAKNATLMEFLTTHVPATSQDIDNAQTWQLAFGHAEKYRNANADISKDELLSKAIENLSKIDVVGVFENLPKLKRDIESNLQVKLTEPKREINRTKSRPKMDYSNIDVRNAIYQRNELDVALHDFALRKFGI